jgi:lambda family phage portal protein
MVQDALETDNQNFGWYQTYRDMWNQKRPAMLGDVRVPALAPGEDIKTVKAERPGTNFSPFAHEMLRGVAACLGLSAQQVTQDYSEMNFSASRLAANEAEKTFDRRLADFNANTATPILGALLAEAMDRGELPMPKNALPYIEGRSYYTRGRWLPAAKGWVDPVVERQGEILGLDAGFNTLEDVCARQGVDYEETLRQRSREVKMMEDLGLPMPVWVGQQADSGGSRDQPQKQQKAYETTKKPLPA